jgi:transposase-like protein
MADTSSSPPDAIVAPGAKGEAAVDGERTMRLLAMLRQHWQPTSCPRCGETRLHGWGCSSSGRRRARCLGCGRAFSETSGSPLARLHHPDKLMALLADMLAGRTRSCRALAADLQVGKNTVWRWRSLILAALRAIDAPAPEHPAAAATHVVRESRKASREWARHRTDPSTWPAPDRARWVDVDRGREPEPTPRAAYRLTVTVLQRNEHSSLQALLPPHDHAMARPSTAASADGADIPQPANMFHCATRETWSAQSHSSWRDASATSPWDRRPTAAEIDRLSEPFRRFLKAFRGPARKHLAGYTAWFNARQRASPDRWIEEACMALRVGRPTGHGDMPGIPP